MRRSALTALAVIALFSAPAVCDVVQMRDGTTYEGKATRKEKVVVIETPLGKFEVDAADVVLITPSAVREPTPSEAPATRPVFSVEPLRPLSAEQITHPEPLIFTLMRNLAGSGAGADSYELRQQIERWRIAAHDRKRRVQTQWLGPADFTQRRKAYAKVLKDGEDLLQKARYASSTDPKAQADRKKAIAAAHDRLETAASGWADPVIHNFLVGVLAYHRGEFSQAEALFRKCIDEAPLVAAFHQGRALALEGLDRPLPALEEWLAALAIRPDSRDLLQDIQRAMRKTPGAKIRDPVYVRAGQALAQYSDRDKEPFTPRGINWLLPGKEWAAKDLSLPTPTQDRLVFRQTLGVPVGKNTLLVDLAVTKDAQEFLVRIDGNTVATAWLRRIGSSYSSSKTPPPPLALLAVSGYEFTVPKMVEDANAMPREAQVSASSVPAYAEMGSFPRTVPGRLSPPAAGAGPTVTTTLLPGESAAPVFTADGTLIGFLAAKTDPYADGGGPDKFIPLWQAASLLKQARSATSDSYSSGGYGRVRRNPTTQPAGAATYLVHVAAGETLEP